MSLQEILILEHVSNTGANGSLLPCFEGVLSILDCGIELVVSGLGDLAHKLLGSLRSSYKNSLNLTGLITSKERGPLDSTH